MLLSALLVGPVLLGAQGKLIKKDVVVGKGPAAKAGDILVVDYKGTLANGKVFDQSFGKPPFSFTLGAQQVIKGWDQGMAGMKVGGKRILTVPPALGYGSRDMGDIPPNSTLNFEVRLYHIWPKDTVQKVVVKDLKLGTGPSARSGSSVDVHYRGTFPNGFKFDSSYDRKQPFTVTIGAGQVIPGFDFGLTGMKRGGKRKIIIHPDMAYGPQGAGGGVIPPNATIVFELEMLNVR